VPDFSSLCLELALSLHPPHTALASPFASDLQQEQLASALPEQLPQADLTSDLVAQSPYADLDSFLASALQQEPLASFLVLAAFASDEQQDDFADALSHLVVADFDFDDTFLAFDDEVEAVDEAATVALYPIFSNP
jgi:hypothetical protein